MLIHNVTLDPKDIPWNSLSRVNDNCIYTTSGMEEGGKENQTSSNSDRANDRRKQLEEYKRAKQKKREEDKNAKKPASVTISKRETLSSRNSPKAGPKISQPSPRFTRLQQQNSHNNLELTTLESTNDKVSQNPDVLQPEQLSTIQKNLNCPENHPNERADLKASNDDDDDAEERSTMEETNFKVAIELSIISEKKFSPIDHHDTGETCCESSFQKTINIKQDVLFKGFKLDWTRPVYLAIDKSYQRILRPSLRLFRWSQIEKVALAGQLEMARLMLSVLAAPGQCRRLDARHYSQYWKLKLRIYPKYNHHTFISEARNYLSPEDLSLLCSKVESNATPTKISSKEEASFSPPTIFFNLDFLPEESAIPIISEDDEETRRMQDEIDEVILRTPAIQNVTPPRSTRVLREAASLIRDTFLYDRTEFITRTTVKPKRPIQTKMEEGGSAYLYAMITPKKRIQTMLETEIVVSPVRRSKRLLSRSSPPGKGRRRLFTKLEDVPNLVDFGFLPNSCITAGVSDLMNQRQANIGPVDSPNNASVPLLETKSYAPLEGDLQGPPPNTKKGSNEQTPP